MRKRPTLFLMIGIIILAIGFNLPTSTPYFYWLTIILSGVGGFIFGFALRHLNKD